MKIVMMGAGGVGGFFGGHLLRAGCDVTFVARGAHLAALRQSGLLIESASLGDIHVSKVQVTDDPTEIGRADLVIISVKLWETEAAARLIAPLLGPETGILSLQNGVIKDEILRAKLGSGGLMGGVAYVATNITRPGVIHQAGAMQRIVIGEYDGRISTRVDYLQKALAHSGIDAEASSDVLRVIWEKFVFLVGLSATTTLMRMPIGKIRNNERARALLYSLMSEAVSVGRARGVALPVDYAKLRLNFADTVPADMASSMFHDLEKGNRLELDWLSGGVVAMGKVAGVPTPANQFVCDALAIHANGATK